MGGGCASGAVGHSDADRVLVATNSKEFHVVVRQLPASRQPRAPITDVNFQLVPIGIEKVVRVSFARVLLPTSSAARANRGYRLCKAFGRHAERQVRVLGGWLRGRVRRVRGRAKSTHQPTSTRPSSNVRVGETPRLVHRIRTNARAARPTALRGSGFQPQPFRQASRLGTIARGPVP